MRWDVVGLPTLAGDVPMEPESTALLIIDMQNRAVKPDRFEGLARILRDRYPAAAAYYQEQLEAVVPNNQRLLRRFREGGMRAIFLTVGPSLDDGSDMISTFNAGYDAIRGDTGMRSLFPAGSSEHQIIDELDPRENELVVNKTSSSPFTTTGIALTLRQLGIETLVCTGVVTDACVATTARDAADHGFHTVIVDDACAALSKEMHDAALRSHAVWAGAVRSTDDVIGLLPRATEIGAFPSEIANDPRN